MTELRHYTSFEDLKNSEVSTQPALSPAAAEARQKAWMELFELMRASAEPSRPNESSDAK